MKNEDLDEILTLIKQEIHDAKIRAFDKMLHYILSNKPSGSVYDGMADELVTIYDAYKDDIRDIVKMYAPTEPDDKTSTMYDFLKDLKDMYD